MTEKERRLLLAVGDALHTFMMCSKEETTNWPSMRELHDALVAVKIDGTVVKPIPWEEWERMSGIELGAAETSK